LLILCSRSYMAVSEALSLPPLFDGGRTAVVLEIAEPECNDGPRAEPSTGRLVQLPSLAQ